MSRYYGPSGLVGALNVLNVSETPQGAATLTEVIGRWGSRYLVEGRTEAQLFLSGELTTLNHEAGSIDAVNASGGVGWHAPQIQGVVDGGEVSIAAVRVDFVNKLVWANISGTPAPIDGVTLPAWTSDGIPLFSFSAVSGAQGLSVAAVEAGWGGDASGLQAEGWTVQSTGVNALGLTGWAELSGMRVTDQARDILTYGLGIKQDSTGYNVLNAINGDAEGWGKLRVGLGMRVTDLSLNDGPGPRTDVLAPVRLVPEPGTYALMGLGLVGLAWARSRQRRTSIR